MSEPSSVNLSPGELQRYERNTAAALRKQRLLEVRETEKAAAKARREDFRKAQEREERRRQTLERKALLEEKQRELLSLKALHEAAVAAEGEADRSAAELRLLHDLETARAHEVERERRSVEEKRSRVALAEVRNVHHEQKQLEELKEERRHLVRDAENQRAIETANRARALAVQRAEEAARATHVSQTVKSSVVPRRDGRGEIDWSKTTYHVKVESESIIEAQRDRDLSPAPAMSAEQVRRAEIRGSVAQARESGQIRDDSTERKLKQLQGQVLRAKAKRGAPAGPRPPAPAVPWEILEKALEAEIEEEPPPVSPPEQWSTGCKKSSLQKSRSELVALDNGILGHPEAPALQQHIKLNSSRRERSVPSQLASKRHMYASKPSVQISQRPIGTRVPTGGMATSSSAEDSKLSSSSSSFTPESFIYDSPLRPNRASGEELELSDESLAYGSPFEARQGVSDDSLMYSSPSQYQIRGRQFSGGESQGNGSYRQTKTQLPPQPGFDNGMERSKSSSAGDSSYHQTLTPPRPQAGSDSVKERPSPAVAISDPDVMHSSATKTDSADSSSMGDVVKDVMRSSADSADSSSMGNIVSGSQGFETSTQLQQGNRASAITEKGSSLWKTGVPSLNLGSPAAVAEGFSIPFSDDLHSIASKASTAEFTLTMRDAVDDKDRSPSKSNAGIKKTGADESSWGLGILNPSNSVAAGEDSSVPFSDTATLDASFAGTAQQKRTASASSSSTTWATRTLDRQSHSSDRVPVQVTSKPSTLGESELRAQLDAICRELSMGEI